MAKLSNSVLEELLEAAKDAPLYFDDDPMNRAIRARQQLAALALTLAREVLKRRIAGQVLAEQLELHVRADHFTLCGHSSTFELCKAQPCAGDRALIATWAKLDEEEESGEEQATQWWRSR